MTNDQPVARVGVAEALLTLATVAYVAASFCFAFAFSSPKSYTGPLPFTIQLLLVGIVFLDALAVMAIHKSPPHVKELHGLRFAGWIAITFLVPATIAFVAAPDGAHGQSRLVFSMFVGASQQGMLILGLVGLHATLRAGRLRAP